MSEFSKKWVRKTKFGKRGGSKRFFNNFNSEAPLKFTLQRAEKTILNQLYKLDILLNKLRDKDNKLLNRIILNIQKNDNKHATIFANELAEIRKMMRMVAQARYALEAISLRIKTVQDLGEVVVSLAPAVAAVKNVQQGVTGIIPTAEDRFTEITGLLSDIIVDAGQSNETKLDFKLANEDAEKILYEASIMAEKNIKEKIPDIPNNIPKSISHTLEEALA